MFVTVLLAIFLMAPGVVSGQQADPLSLERPDPSVQDSSEVRYEADKVTYDFETRWMTLEGKVKLRYREIELSAGRVVFDRAAGVLEAEGIPDSTGTIDELPVFRRGAEVVHGNRMSYHLESGRGQVWEGRTTFERKYLHGKTIRTASDRTIHIRGGVITTCDLDHPHTDFFCRDLKVIPDEKVIARSVLFRVGGVPLAWVPFYVFPIKKGRHSGILTPNFGSNDRDGLFVTNLGYYFGSSDYWDATANLSLRERGGALVRTNARYALRNRYNGSVDVAFETRDVGGGTTGRDWRVEARHYQRLGRTANLRGSGNFLSRREFNRDNSTNAFDRLNRSMRSNLSYDRRWAGSGNSIQAIFLHEQNLETDVSRFLSFPSLTFRGGHRPLYRPKGSEVGARGSGRARGGGRRWYETIFYSFNGGLRNAFTRDGQAGKNTEDLQLTGGLSMSSQQKAWGWLNFTPGLSTSQRVSHNDKDLPTRFEQYSASTSVGSTFYGLFESRVGRLRAIRHVVRPNLSFRYSQRATVRRGTFGFGGAREAEDPRRSLGMGLGNTFQVKTEREGRERRSDFATIDLFTNYDFDAAEKGWTPLRLSGALKPDRRFDVRLSAVMDLYDPAGDFRLLRPFVTSLNLTSILRLSGRQGADEERGPDRPIPGRRTYRTPAHVPGFGFERDLYSDVVDSRQPWRLNLTHYHTLSRFRPSTGTASRTNSTLKFGAGFNPTGGWRFDYSINAGLAPDRRLTAQTLSIYRDLHEWEAQVSWTPTGFNKGTYFKLNLKDIPQFKIERRTGAIGGF